jgi:hypothetical protein
VEDIPIDARMTVKRPSEYDDGFAERVGYYALPTKQPKRDGKRPMGSTVERPLPFWGGEATHQDVPNARSLTHTRSSATTAIEYDADDGDMLWLSNQAGTTVAAFTLIPVFRAVVEEFEKIVSMYLKGKDIRETWSHKTPSTIHVWPEPVLEYLRSKVLEGKLKFVGVPFMSSVENCAMQPQLETIGRRSNRRVCFRSLESTESAREKKRLRTYGASGPAWKPSEVHQLSIADRPIRFKVRRSVFIREEPYVEYFNATPAFGGSAPSAGQCWKPMMTYIGVELKGELASLLTNPTTADLSDAMGEPFELWDVKEKKVKAGGGKTKTPSKP